MKANLWSPAVGSQGPAEVLDYQDVAAFLEAFYATSDGPSFKFLSTLASKDSSRLHVVAQLSSSKGSSASVSVDYVLAAAWYCVVLDEAELLDIQVLPSARRRGLGRFLLQCSLGALTVEGIKTCHLEARRSNTAALTLYHELGFQKVGERANYYQFQETREDAILLSMSPLL